MQSSPRLLLRETVVAAAAAMPRPAAGAALFDTTNTNRGRHTYQKHQLQTHVAIIGAGLSGIATAYYLVRNHGIHNIVLVDALSQPMAFTSAQSGENYRNWWPHPTMKALADRSIDLMQEISLESQDRIRLTRRGYLLATRDEQTAHDLVSRLVVDGDTNHHHHHHPTEQVREYRSDRNANVSIPPYQPPLQSYWQAAGPPDGGVDVLHASSGLIEKHFPMLDPTVQSLVHIRRAGDVSGQQLGSFMLDYIRDKTMNSNTATDSDDGVKKTNGSHYSARVLTNATVQSLERESPNDTFRLELVPTAATTDGSHPGSPSMALPHELIADKVVIAAGPLAGDLVSHHLGVNLPLQSYFHQKIAFDDYLHTIPRTMPFMIDLDEQVLDWSDEERELLQADPEVEWMANTTMPGCVHCRPDGGDHGSWVKLGWAFNTTPSSSIDLEASISHLTDFLPDILIRGAARLNPALARYYHDDGGGGGSSLLPRNRMHHYGGYYSMTEENWPIVGPIATTAGDGAVVISDDNKKGDVMKNAFVNCAPSGFGTMTACATGELCAAWVAGTITGDDDIRHHQHAQDSSNVLPWHNMNRLASDLSMQRYENSKLMEELQQLEKGVL